MKEQWERTSGRIELLSFVYLNRIDRYDGSLSGEMISGLGTHLGAE